MAEYGDSSLTAAQSDSITEEKLSLDVLLDACLGAALSVSCVILTFVNVVWSQGTHLEQGCYVVALAITLTVMFALGWLNTDRLHTKAGRTALAVAYIVCLVLSVAGCFIRVYPLAIVSASVALAATAFIYSDFLNTLPRRTLMTVVDTLVLCIGLLMPIFISLDSFAAQIMHIAVAVIALGLTFVFMRSRRNVKPEAFISAENSKAHNIPLKGNKNTLFLVGFMLSAFVMGFWIDIPQVGTVIVWGVLGGVIAVAGVFSLIMRGFDEKEYKNLLLKGMAAYSAVLLLPLTLFSPPIQFVFLALFLFLTTLEVIIIINAIIESARFNMISPIWLYGKEGAMFCAGLAVGAALFTIGGYFYQTMPLALNAAVCIAVIVCAIAQLRVNYQCYPFESVLDNDEDGHDIIEAQEETGRHRTLWHRKIEAACDRYKLSPREREVLQILLRGRDTKYIMDTFCISQSTAKTHIYNIYRKFDIHSRQDLIDFIEEINPDSAQQE